MSALPRPMTHGDPTQRDDGAGQWLSQQGLSVIWEQAADAMAISNADGIVLAANPAYYELYGYPPDQVIGHSFAIIFPLDQRASAEDHYRSLFGSGDDLPVYEATICRADGVERVVETHATFIMTADAQPVLLSIIRDITERKRAAVVEQQFASMAEASGEFIGMCDMQMRPFYINAAGLRMVGLDDLNQAQQTSVAEFFYPEDLPFLMDVFLARVQQDGHGEIETRFRHFKTGEPLWMIYSVVTLTDERGKPSGFGTVTRNITERKRAEAALRVSEDRYRALTELAPQFVFMSGPDGQITFANQYAQEFTGRTLDELRGGGWAEGIRPDARERARNAWLVATKQVSEYNDEVPFRHADGSYRWLHARATPITDAAGAITHWIGLALDITDRKIAEQALAERERLLGILLKISDAARELLHDVDIARMAGRLVKAETGAVSCSYGFVYPEADRVLIVADACDVDNGVPCIEGEWTLSSFGRELIALHEQGDPVVIEDTAIHPATAAFQQSIFDAMHTRALISIPLVRDGQLVAYFSIHDRQPRRYTTAEVTLLRSVAVRVWEAIQRSRAEAALRASEARQTLLLRLMGRQRETSDPNVMMAAAAEAVGRYLRVNRIGFFEMADDDTLHFTISWTDGVLAPLAGMFPAPGIGTRYLAEVRSGRTLGIADTISDPLTADSLFGAIGARAIIGAPIIRNGRWHAGLYINHAEVRQWTDDEIAMVREVADQTWDAVERARTQDALRASEAMLQAALDGSRLGVWSWDPVLNQTKADRRVIELFGFDPGSFTGDASAIFDRVYSEDRAVAYRALQQSQQPGGQYEAEFRVQLPDGQLRWLAGAGRARTGSDGQVTQVYGVNFDITERKRAELNTGFLLALDATLAPLADADAIEQAVVERLGAYLDVAQCYFGQITANQVGVLHEYRRDAVSIIGAYDLDAFFAPVARAQLAAGGAMVVTDTQVDTWTVASAVSHAALGIRAFITVPVKYHDRWVGALTCVSSTPRAWRTDDVQLLREVVARAWPLMEHARTYAALRSSEARLQLLYAQEQAARTQAEEASRLKDEFLATVSHELRTPLTAFLGYAQLLQLRKRDEDYIIRTVEKMVRSAKSQAQLIEDLLDVSRIVSGKLHIERLPTDLIAVIHAALDTVRPAVEAKGLHIQLTLHPEANTITGDANRLQQVVWNLLSNATKFTPSGGIISVGLEAVDQQAQLTVSDTGQGINVAFLPYVFDRFRQAESSSTRSHNGLGLGLAITRHLVELHGGTVAVASAGKNQGATFTVRLPLATTREPALQAGGPDTAIIDYPPELRGLRILLVDDQPDILELLHELFTACSSIVRACSNARDALETLRAWRPDVLVSDIAMPGDDGYWLIRQVRALPPEEGGAIPAVALTAYVRMEERMRVLVSGFQLYVPKPVEPVELLTVVASLAQTSATS